MISSRCEYLDHSGCAYFFSGFTCTCHCHSRKTQRQECVKVTITFEDAAGNKVHVETDKFDYAEFGVEDLTPPYEFSFKRALPPRRFELSAFVKNVTHYVLRHEPAKPAIEEDIIDVEIGDGDGGR